MIKVQDLVKKAWQTGCVIPNISAPYLPMINPIIKAAIDQRAHIIVSVARVEWIKFGSKSMSAVKEEFDSCEPPPYVHLHLDHVPIVDEDYQQIDYKAILTEGIALGYESVMVDGSRLPLDQNIAFTRSAVEMAANAGIPCEAELGVVLGHESGPLPPYKELFESGKGFTIVEEASRFVRETDCSWLSVSIGNVHGAIAEATRNQKKIEARLNLQHLAKLHKIVGIPLVLHGGSGIQFDDLQTAIKGGIAKINIGTDTRQAYENTYAETNNVEAAQEAVYKKATWLIRDYFGSAGTLDAIY